MNEIDSIRDLLSDLRERLRDHSIALLSDAVYRNDSNAKTLERQCAKIGRALDKAIYECDSLRKMSN